MTQPREVVLIQEPPEYSPATNIPAVICHRCGAVVLRMDKHSEWHVSLTAAIHHLSDGVISLFLAQPEGKELLAEIEAEQRQSEDTKEVVPKGVED